MPRRTLPTELDALLHASENGARAHHWSRFVDTHTPLIMSAAASRGPRGHDDVMDRYLYVLERLECDDFRRLRAYAASPDAEFEIWLVAVVRRLCIDLHRKKYGRCREGTQDGDGGVRAARKNLVDLVGPDIDLTPIAASSSYDPEVRLRRQELDGLLSSEVARLPAADRLLLNLRFRDDVPVREIAKIQRYPSVFHVYRRLKSVLGEVRRGLANHGVERADP